MYKTFKNESEKQEILLRIAENYEIQGSYDDAEKTYRKCCKLDNARAFMKIGNLLIKRGKIYEGVENLEKANCIERCNIEIETKLVYGYSLREETTDKAFSLANTILKRNPESLETLIMITNILVKKGKVR